MHDDIKKFSINGEIADSDLVRGKERLVDFVETQMRDAGCVPALDLEPQFTLNYVVEHEKYKFVLTVYGIHVGRERSCQVAGVMNGKPILKHIQPIR